MSTILAFLGSATGLVTSLNPWLTVFGGALGLIATWFVNKYISKKQQEKDAEAGMQQSMDEHAGDGAQSVVDSESGNAQLDSLKQTLDAIDSANQQPPPPKKEN